MSVTQTIDTNQSINVIQAMALAISEQQDYLSSLDSMVGDGDHGLNLAKALAKAVWQVTEIEEPTLESVWRIMGWGLQNSVGGASGLLFGAFFIGASRILKDKEVLSLPDVAAMLAAGLAEVQKRGKAQPGDKTMVDALVPAVEAAQAAVTNNLVLAEALHRIAEAAQAGAEATREMVARHGRAKFLGERSRGYQDAGATSIALMLRAWVDTVKEMGD